MKKISTLMCMLLVIISTGAQNGPGQRWAVVELSAIYMRAGADYESALETQEIMGTVVEIVEEKGYWRKIVSPQPYTAWCTEKGLVEMDAKELEAYKTADKCMYTGLYGHVFIRPSFKAGTVCDLVGGDIMRFVRKKGRWTEVLLPSGRKGWVPSKELRMHEGFISIAKGEGNSSSVTEKQTEAIIAEATKLVGSPYLWGGMTAKGVDCSGLVRISYLMNGIHLPRNASQQIFCGDPVRMDMDERFWKDDEREDKEAFRKEMQQRTRHLQRGDLVFFGTPKTLLRKQKVTHVGIYIGEGKIIHSSHMVRINSLIPGENDYYENSHRLLGARRL